MLGSKTFQYTLAAVYSLLILLIGHSITLPWEQDESSEGRHKQISRLLIQQLDRLSMNHLDKMPTDRPLTEQEISGVNAWLLFDKQFVDLQRDDSIYAFEVATAARRAGYASAILGDMGQAEQMLLESVQLFEKLKQEYAAGVSYRFEESATRMQLANLYEQTLQAESATRQIQQSLAALDSTTLPRNGEFVLQSAQTYLLAAKQLIRLGEKSLAARTLSDNITFLQEIVTATGSSSELNQLIDESRTLLKGLQNV